MSLLTNERLRVRGEFLDLDQELATRSPASFRALYCDPAVQTFTECGSKSGIAVSLVEGIIAMSKVLWLMDLSSPEVQEALKDMKDVYELSMLLALETESPQGRMHDEKWRKEGQ